MFQCAALIGERQQQGRFVRQRYFVLFSSFDTLGRDGYFMRLNRRQELFSDVDADGSMSRASPNRSRCTSPEIPIQSTDVNHGPRAHNYPCILLWGKNSKAQA